MSFATALEKATGENQQTEEWQAIMEFSDKVSGADEGGRNEAIQAITRRLNHARPQVQLHTITVVTTCVKNCGRPFHSALCNNREFFPEVKKIVNSIKSDMNVVAKLKELLLEMQKEFRDASQRTVAGVISSLKDSGIAFDDGQPARPAAAAASSSSSSARDREDAELQRALAESLQMVVTKPQQPPQPPRGLGKARALYDFDAREENELAVRAGEVVTLLDTSDSNWWRGRNAAGQEGCFPANFMSTDVGDAAAAPAAPAPAPTPARPQSQEINIALLDQLMKSIAQLTPGQQPPAQLDEMMAAHNAMKPTVKARVAACSERKRALEDACTKFQQTMARYDTLMQAPLPAPPPPAAVYYPPAAATFTAPPMGDPRLTASAYAAPYPTAPALAPPHPHAQAPGSYPPAPTYGVPGPASIPQGIYSHAQSPAPAAPTYAPSPVNVAPYSPAPPAPAPAPAPAPSPYHTAPSASPYSPAPTPAYGMPQQQLQSWQYGAVPRN